MISPLFTQKHKNKEIHTLDFFLFYLFLFFILCYYKDFNYDIYFY